MDDWKYGHGAHFGICQHIAINKGMGIDWTEYGLREKRG